MLFSDNIEWNFLLRTIPTPKLLYFPDRSKEYSGGCPKYSVKLDVDSFPTFVAFSFPAKTWVAYSATKYSASLIKLHMMHINQGKREIDHKSQ
jgi:hypothetical protein